MASSLNVLQLYSTGTSEPGLSVEARPERVAARDDRVQSSCCAHQSSGNG